ncbi:AraC family transcriptional regulator [Nocardiopsis coralliicola]
MWRHPGLPGTDLLRAHYVRHTFPPHSHDTYTIAVIDAGLEEYRYRGTLQRSGPDSLALVEPGVVHTGNAGVPEGWRYRVQYPEEPVVTAAAADLGHRGPVLFTSSSPHDPELAALLRSSHRAAEHGDALSASSLARQALHGLVARHARAPSGRPTAAAGPAAVAQARQLLESRLTDPPTLEELAAHCGTAPFALLRAFRSVHGLPPHAYLTDLRVRRARSLLAGGLPPADTAASVGFADQAHLTRHFKRRVGVPPGAFQRGAARPPG